MKVFRKSILEIIFHGMTLNPLPFGKGIKNIRFEKTKWKSHPRQKNNRNNKIFKTISKLLFKKLIIYKLKIFNKRKTKK